MDKNLKKRLQALLNAIVAEANTNENFAKKLSDALEIGDYPADKPKTESNAKREANRRDPAILDPVQMVMDGDSSLPQRLNSLTEKELKDIIADYGMDSSKLAMKWKNKEKLVELILDTAASEKSTLFSLYIKSMHFFGRKTYTCNSFQKKSIFPYLQNISSISLCKTYSPSSGIALHHAIPFHIIFFITNIFRLLGKYSFCFIIIYI